MKLLTPLRTSNSPLSNSVDSASGEPDNSHAIDTPPSLYDLKETSGSTSKLGGIISMPVSSTPVLLMLNQLAVMSQNGVELAEAVAHASDHCEDPRLAASLEAIYDAVSGGSRFSVAVSRHGHYFPPSLPAMLAAAEATGEVPDTLATVCQRLRGEVEMRDTIVRATIYPVILLLAAVLVMAALALGVLPQIGRVLESMGKPVPPSTDFLLAIGRFANTYWVQFVAIAFAFALITISFLRHPLAPGLLGKILPDAPVIRDAYRPLAAGRNFRTIAAMVPGGVPLLQAVRLTRNTIRDRSWGDLLDRVEKNLIDGRSASDAMAEVDFLPGEATQMMATGERTGKVAEVLEDVGNFDEQEGIRRIKRLVVALEPMIILIMGVVVAGVVTAVMLPLLEVSGVQS